MITMTNSLRCFLTLALFALVAAPVSADFPPGWLPVSRLDEKPTWEEFRKIDDKIHLYLPKDVKTVRGVFACFVFHSQDPRQLADLWEFALVTVPWPFEYDLGHNDKRNGRFKLGHPVGDMGTFLRYLEAAAKETKHPELTTVPIVGWLMQNGPKLGGDLFKRASERVLAWSDGFPRPVAEAAYMTAKVPFAYAWEFSPAEEKERRTLREAKIDMLKDKPTPPPNFACRANTYGFPHGVYSKFNFFAFYLDRCIAQRLPKELPEPGKPVVLKPWVKEDGWAGDYNEISNWNAIAPVKEAKGMVDPQWLPDEYAAWAWRSYHTHRPELQMTAPVVDFRKAAERKVKDCGLGFSPPIKPGTPLKFAAEGTGEFAKVEFYTGNRLLGISDKAPWKLDEVKLDRGLHALFAVGVKTDGARTSSRPALLMVK
jgi:hypothetical protein